MKIMKPAILLLTAFLLILSSCSSINRIFVNHDDFKGVTNVKLTQTMKGYSDEYGRRAFDPVYHVTFKHYYSVDADGKDTYDLDVKLSTVVRAYEIDPVLYINIDGVKYELDSEKKVTRMYQQGSTTTSSETSTTTTDDPDDDEDSAPETETTTTYSTTSSHNTYQLMQLKFDPSPELMKMLRQAKAVTFRIYIENEAIDIKFRSRFKTRFNQFVERTMEISP